MNTMASPLLALFLLGAASSAYGMTCRFEGDDNKPALIGTVGIPYHAGVGEELPPLRPPAPAGGDYALVCTNKSEHASDFSVTFAVTPPNPAIADDSYVTNLAGVGIRYALGGSCMRSPAGQFERLRGGMTLTCTVPARSTQRFVWHTLASFVKTGVIEAGRLRRVPAVTVQLTLPGDPTRPLPNMYSGLGIGTFVPPTCNATAPATFLGATPSTGAAGATGPGFPVVPLVQCASPMPGLRYAFSAPPGVATYDGGLFDLNLASTAKGVALRLSDAHDQGIAWRTFAPLRHAHGRPTTHELPLRVRYVQTGGVVTPGKADGVLLMSVSYQ